MDKARILIVDDHPIVREGMANFLNIQDDLHLCCQAATAAEALAVMPIHRHELAIIDISLDDGSGLEVISALRESYPELAILTLSMHDESIFAERALRAGANGYLMKQEGTRNILSAVRALLAGDTYLSPAMHNKLLTRAATGQSADASLLAGLSAREFEVLHLIGLGLSTREISEKLNRSVKTIEAHCANLKEKLKLESGRDLARFAIQMLNTR